MKTIADKMLFWKTMKPFLSEKYNYTFKTSLVHNSFVHIYCSILNGQKDLKTSLVMWWII